jgi:hypothetical protein
MFLAMFWAVYVPLSLVIFSVLHDWMMRLFRCLRARARYGDKGC